MIDNHISATTGGAKFVDEAATGVHPARGGAETDYWKIFAGHILRTIRKIASLLRFRLRQSELDRRPAYQGDGRKAEKAGIEAIGLCDCSKYRVAQ